MGNNEKIAVFAVALPRFSDRYKHITRHLTDLFGADFEVIGVYGREVEPSRFVAEANLTPGQVGCSLSHVEICRRIVERDLPYALVVEDDIVLPPDIGVILREAVSRLGDGEVIQLYNWTPYPATFSRVGAEPMAGGKLYYPAEMRAMGTTGAYVISRRAAEGILSVNDPVVVTADNWEYFHAKGAVITARALIPSPVSLKSFETTVLPGSAGPGFAGRLVGFAKKVLAPVRNLRRHLMISQRGSSDVFVDTPSPFQKNGAPSRPSV